MNTIKHIFFEAQTSITAPLCRNYSLNTDSTDLYFAVSYFKLTQKSKVLSDFLRRNILCSNHLFYDVQMNCKQLTLYDSFDVEVMLYSVYIVHTDAILNEDILLNNDTTN